MDICAREKKRITSFTVTKVSEAREQIQRETDGQTQAETERQRQIETDIQTDAQTETETERERMLLYKGHRMQVQDETQ